MENGKIQLNLRQMRLLAGLTQQEAADALGVSNISVGRWENGDFIPRSDKWETIANVYGQPLEEVEKYLKGVHEQCLKVRTRQQYAKVLSASEEAQRSIDSLLQREIESSLQSFLTE